ncbi:MAG TPA: amidohydrolase, partial [Thermoanaerobaculia bacterium]|nr:amidohydrolase [Thermoanaerobaculia bacterium]
MIKRLLMCSFLAAPLLAQSVIINNPGTRGTFAIRNATIHPVTSAPVPNGTIVFSNGVITAVGAGVAVPAGATVVDGTGLSVYPGLIDAGSKVGLVEISSVAGTVDTTELGDMNPNARADVAINPHSNLVNVTRVNGVTAVLTVPAGGVISGQSALIQLAGWTPPEMVIKSPVAMHLRFPLLRSRPLVELPAEEEAEKELRKTYSRQLDKLRDVFRDAQAYGKAAAARTTDGTVRRFNRDLVLEALVPVVEGKVPVIIEANLERDIRAALEFADEFKLKAMISGAQDVVPVIPEIKRRNIAVIIGPILELPPREDDPYDLLYANAAALHEAGVPFAIRTDDDHNTRNLPYHAATAAAFG